MEINVCCICSKELKGYGNNALPVKDGTCCDECNLSVVVLARIKQIGGEKVEKQNVFYTKKDCIRDMCDDSVDTNEGCIAIYDINKLSENFRTGDYQLVRLNGGFGCNPEANGNACYVKFCIDGEECRLERYDFLGIANEEVTKYAEELERTGNIREVLK